MASPPSTTATAPSLDAARFQTRRFTAARMPRRISMGGGGQPGTLTSTGITCDTAPQLA